MEKLGKVCQELLKSPFHEVRMLGLLILVAKYARGTKAEQERIYRCYLRYKQYINNWDLVDLSAEHVVGAYLLARDRKPIYRLARSKSLWDRRIAMLARFILCARMTSQIRWR